MKRQKKLKTNKECIKAQKHIHKLTEFIGNIISKELKKKQISEYITEHAPNKVNIVGEKGKEIFKLNNGTIVKPRTKSSIPIFNNIDEKHITNPDRL